MGYSTTPEEVLSSRSYKYYVAAHADGAVSALNAGFPVRIKYPNTAPYGTVNFAWRNFLRQKGITAHIKRERYLNHFAVIISSVAHTSGQVETANERAAQDQASIERAIATLEKQKAKGDKRDIHAEMLGRPPEPWTEVDELLLSGYKKQLLKMAAKAAQDDEEGDPDDLFKDATKEERQ